MPTVIQNVKDRAYANLALKTREVEDETNIDDPGPVYDPETGEITVPMIEKPLELTFEMQAIIDCVCEAIIEMCAEEGLLLKDVDITAGATVDGGITSDTLDVVG